MDNQVSICFHLLTQSRLIFPVALALAIFTVVHLLRLLKGNKVLTMYLPVVGMFPTYLLSLNTRFHDIVTDVLHDYNGTFTLKGPWFCNFEFVATSDPCNLEYILKTNFSNFRKGQTAFAVTNDFLGKSLFSADDEWRQSLRKIVSLKLRVAEFNEIWMELWAELIKTRVLPILDHFMTQSVAFDLQEMLSRMSFDQSCRMTFGIDSNHLSHSPQIEKFATAFTKAEEVTTLRFYCPMFVWKVMRYLNLGWERDMKTSVQHLNEFVYKVIASRRMEFSQNYNKKKSNSSLLSMFIESEDDKRTYAAAPDLFLRDCCLNFVFAGSDTIPSALSWFFWLLHKHPVVEQKIYGEICNIVRKTGMFDGRGEEDTDAIFKLEEVKKMTYLHAALTESLRLYTPVPLNQLEVLEDDQLPNGLKVRKGVKVIACMYAMGRTESIWGADCREFKPERWFRDGKFMPESPYKFSSFSAGPRICLGKDLSYYQMKVLVASIIYRYRVNVMKNHPVVTRLSMMLHMKYGLKVTLGRRA